jgi:FkbM family methyltransferase
MKKTIKLLIEKIGYKIYNKYFMDCGIDLEYDISKFTPLNEMKTIFDVGANAGYMTKFYRRIFPNSTIYSFEPISDTFEILKKKLKFQNNIKLFNIGFSDRTSKEKIYLQSDSGFNSINEKVNIPDEKMKGIFETISVETIDDFCSSNNIKSIDFLKTDTEGLDLKVLMGAEGLIKSGKIKYILVEVGFNEDNHRNTSFEEVRSYLFNYGYKLRGFHDQHNFGNVPYITCVNALFLLQKK